MTLVGGRELTQCAVPMGVVGGCTRPFEGSAAPHGTAVIPKAAGFSHRRAQASRGATIDFRAHWPFMTAVLTTLLGGLLAIAVGLVGIALSDRRDRSSWLRDSQLPANTHLLSALHLLV